MLCFVVVTQSFIMNSHELFIHIHQVCFAGTGAIVRLPQCQWSKPDGYGKISPCITTTKHSKAKTVCIFLGIYCSKRDPILIQQNSHRWPRANLRNIIVPLKMFDYGFLELSIAFVYSQYSPVSIFIFLILDILQFIKTSDMIHLNNVVKLILWYDILITL